MTTSLLARPAPVARGRVSHGAGFWVIAAAFAAALAFSTLPTPFYGIYQRVDGFPTYVVTIVFAAYAVGVVTSLYLAGHVSDWLGRRRVVRAAVLVQALSALVFLGWPQLPGLIVARLVSGVAIGALTATATAHLSELRAIARPGRDSSLISTMVNMGGLALGPIVGGVLATTVDAPLSTPYLIFLVLLVASAVAVTVVPETVERREELPAYRPQRVSLPRASRPVFFAAASVAFAAFALSGLLFALAPSLLAGMRVASPLVSGLVAGSVFASAAVAQIVFAALAARRQLVLGVLAMIAGLIAVPASLVTASVVLLVAGTVFGGVGLGLGFRAAIATVSGLAEPPFRGEVLAAVFLAAYFGLAVPVLSVGVALVWLPTATVLTAFAALEILLLSWAGVRLTRLTPGSRAGTARR